MSKHMSKVRDVNVQVINAWLEDLSRSNSDSTGKEWIYVRVAGIMPVESYKRCVEARYPGEYEWDIPDGTTHALVVGNYFSSTYDSDGVEWQGAIMGNRFWINEDAPITWDMVDETLGGGPDYQDAYSVEEITDWMLEDGMVDIRVYDEVPRPDDLGR